MNTAQARISTAARKSGCSSKNVKFVGERRTKEITLAQTYVPFNEVSFSLKTFGRKFFPFPSWVLLADSLSTSYVSLIVCVCVCISIYLYMYREEKEWRGIFLSVFHRAKRVAFCTTLDKGWKWWSLRMSRALRELSGVEVWSY